MADQVSANAQRQIAAGRAKDAATFARSVQTETQLAARLNTVGARFGFTTNSACGQVFG
jgi:hypothetical protein